MLNYELSLTKKIERAIITASPICVPACGAIHKFQLKRSETRLSIQAETVFLFFIAELKTTCGAIHKCC